MFYFHLSKYGKKKNQMHSVGLTLLMLFSSNKKGVYSFKSWQVNVDRCSFKSLQKRGSLVKVDH